MGTKTVPVWLNWHESSSRYGEEEAVSIGPQEKEKEKTCEILVTVWITRPVLRVRNTRKWIRRLQTYPLLVLTVTAYSRNGNELTISAKLVSGILNVL